MTEEAIVTVAEAINKLSKNTDGGAERIEYSLDSIAEALDKVARALREIAGAIEEHS
ncbi:MAG: hypothetical protein WA728_22760 [Xanthobacteraceae bacterium]